MLLTSPFGLAAHIVEHGVAWSYAVPLAIGGLAGGQIGPRIARRLSSPRILEILAATIAFAALGLILKHVPTQH